MPTYDVYFYLDRDIVTFGLAGRGNARFFKGQAIFTLLKSLQRAGNMQNFVRHLSTISNFSFNYCLCQHMYRHFEEIFSSGECKYRKPASGESVIFIRFRVEPSMFSEHKKLATILCSISFMIRFG